MLSHTPVVLKHAWCAVPRNQSLTVDQVIREYEFYPQVGEHHPDLQLSAAAAKKMKRVNTKQLKLHVVLTSYEMILLDAVALGSVKWEVRTLHYDMKI